MRYTAVLALLVWCLPVQAEITGLWRTVDDETGEVKSVVEIYRQDQQYFGRVVQLLDKPADTLCSKCDGDKKDQPVVGMVIVSDLQLTDGEYTGGSILDPAKGKTYRCKLWLENGKLKVRGYLGFLYRTQTWFRMDESAGS